MSKDAKKSKNKENKEHKLSKEERAELVAGTRDGSITNKQREFIEHLRADLSDQLKQHQDYDTDFNILRWLKAYGFKYDDVRRRLSKHLTLRTLLLLDSVAGRTFDGPIYKDYLPLGWLGETGINNQLAFVEMVGRYDPPGLMKSVEPMTFMLARLQLLDKTLKDINGIEAKTGKQSGVVYVYDLDYIEMDPMLLSIVTGPLRVFWIHISDNFPEMISKLIIINAPSYVHMLYRAIGPFLPDHTREKVIIADSQWKETLLKYIAPERLPEYLGGTRRDCNDDPMCREFMKFPPATGKKIPKELYWKPLPGQPGMDDLMEIHVSAGTRTFKSVHVKEPGLVMHLYLNCDQEYTLAAHYDEDAQSSHDKKEIDALPEYLPRMEQAAVPVVDHQEWPLGNPGTYHFRFGNDKAWLRSVTVRALFALKHADGSDAENLAKYDF